MLRCFDYGGHQRIHFFLRGGTREMTDEGGGCDETSEMKALGPLARFRFQQLNLAGRAWLHIFDRVYSNCPAEMASYIIADPFQKRLIGVKELDRLGPLGKRL